jgi:23S rRNA (guanosine2251-2'-O)-methyltransferase
MRSLHLIAHNIRSCENIGALFRTADSLGIAKIWLTGYTPAPPDTKIHKVALGAENIVPFETSPSIEEALKALKMAQIPVYGLELTRDAIELRDFSAPDELALLLGTETTGISPSLLEQCDGTIQITQHGVKESLNVTIATSIASWWILNQ